MAKRESNGMHNRPEVAAFAATTDEEMMTAPGAERAPPRPDPEAVSAPPDLWQHRSARMRCATCMFWVAKVNYDPGADEDDRGRLGRCRKHAPTLDGYPPVFLTDWCGDHKLDEARAGV